jgi:hypothetical protein
MSEENCSVSISNYNNKHSFDPIEPAKFNTRGFIRIPGLPPLPPFDHTEYKDSEKSNIPLYQVNMRGPIAIILGSEEDGITSDLINLSDIKAKIPMRGAIASLNVSVSAGMILYEKTRQELYGN